MTMQPGWVPPDIDTGKANIARVYDWWLGGDHNFRADQDAARAMIAVEPNARAIARANRAFLGRAVRFLAAEAGIRQFLDIGSGIPTQNNVHQVAQDAAPGARVVYADADDVVVAHSKLILDGNADAAVIQADVRDPASILADPETQLLLDFTQPVAVLLVAVLHFIADADSPEQLVATLRDALPPGSYLVVSHACSDPQARDRVHVRNRVQEQGSRPGPGPHPRGDRPVLRRVHPRRPRTGLASPVAPRAPAGRPRRPGEVLVPGRRRAAGAA